MQFELTKEQRQVRDSMRNYVQEEVEPVAHELDQNHEYPADILEELAEQSCP